MEEFRSSWINVIEERLGPLGRPFTTVIVVVAGLGIIAWGMTQVTNYVERFLGGFSLTIPYWGITLAQGIIVSIGILVLFLWVRHKRKQDRKLIEEIGERQYKHFWENVMAHGDLAGEVKSRLTTIEADMSAIKKILYPPPTLPPTLGPGLRGLSPKDHECRKCR